MKPKAPSYETMDVRSPGERALAESQASYFQNLMNLPEFGYREETAAYDPIYGRAQQQFEKSVSRAAAERGFGMLRHGPSVSAISRGTQEMAENRAATEAAHKDAYRQWVISGGRQAATPTGRSVVQTSAGSPSPFSQLLSPVMTGIGYGVGGPIGGMVAGGFGDILSRGAWAGGARPRAVSSGYNYGV